MAEKFSVRIECEVLFLYGGTLKEGFGVVEQAFCDQSNIFHIRLILLKIICSPLYWVHTIFSPLLLYCSPKEASWEVEQVFCDEQSRFCGYNQLWRGRLDLNIIFIQKPQKLSTLQFLSTMVLWFTMILVIALFTILIRKNYIRMFILSIIWTSRNVLYYFFIETIFMLTFWTDHCLTIFSVTRRSRTDVFTYWLSHG